MNIIIFLSFLCFISTVMGCNQFAVSHPLCRRLDCCRPVRNGQIAKTWDLAQRHSCCRNKPTSTAAPSPQMELEAELIPTKNDFQPPALWKPSPQSEMAWDLEILN